VGYNGWVPGTETRIRNGETRRAAVSNHVPADTSIHWHGLAIVNDMDGVPPLTQSAIPAGGSVTYDFIVPDAGTYRYHYLSGRSWTAGSTAH
jgi:multicopper oxidase